MPEILSQEEIDNLIRSVQDGKPSAPTDAGNTQEYTKYDFRRALHFSKDHFRIINRIHEQFARMFANHLTTRLRTTVTMQVESIDEVPYDELISSLSRLTVAQLMDVQPLQGKIFAEFNMQLVAAMLDYFMGGIGQSKYPERELTDIETKLFQVIINECRLIFSNSWKNFVEIHVDFGSIESNPQFIQIASPNESVLVITFSMKIGEVSGLVNVCIPYITIESVVPKLSSKSYYSAPNDDGSEASKKLHSEVNEHLRNTYIRVSANLGETTLSFQEVLSLSVGDVIPLNQATKEPVRLDSNGTPLWVGHIGIEKGRYAIKVVDAWKDGK